MSRIYRLTLSTLSRASEREREGTHRAAMGRVRVSRDTVLGLPSPGRLRLRSGGHPLPLQSAGEGFLVEPA